MQLGSQRSIDHAAAELDDEPAHDRRVHLHPELDLLAGDRAQRLLKRGAMPFREILGDLEEHTADDVSGAFRELLMNAIEWGGLAGESSVCCTTSPPDSQIAICLRTSASMPRPMWLKEFMFFSSVRVR